MLAARAFRAVPRASRPVERWLAGSRRKQNAKIVRQRRTPSNPSAAAATPPPLLARPVPPPLPPPPAAYQAPPPPQQPFAPEPQSFGQSLMSYATIGVGMTVGIAGFSAILRVIGF